MKRFRFGLIIIILFLGSICLGATKYVATDGNDITGDGSIGNPWLTIKHAYSQISSGDTIKVGTGTYKETTYGQLRLNRAITATIESQSGSNDVWVKPNNTTTIISVSSAGTSTFNNISFMPLGASCSYLLSGGATNSYSVTFNDCVFDMNGVSGAPLFTGTGTGENITYNDCNFTVDNPSSYGCAYLHSINSVIYDDCSFVQTGGTRVLYWVGDSNTLKITDCNFYAPSSTGAVVDIAAGATGDSLDHLIITGNTVNGYRFINIDDEDVRFAKICDNTVTSSGTSTVFVIGKDSGTGTNTLYAFVIKNNILTKSGTSGHCLLLGTNCYGAELSYNKFISNVSGDYGIVIKGNYNNIHHNICKSAQSLYLYQAQYNKVQYNTIYSIGGSAFYWFDAGIPSKQNVITNNIFDASGGTYAMSDAGKSHYDNYIDYNCYKVGNSGTVNLNGTVYNTIATLQAKWATYSDTWPQNDAHSIMADPQLMDAANNDFRLKPTSPCLNTGEPAQDGGYTSIGAWQRKSLLGHK